MAEEAYRDHFMRTMEDNGLLDQLKLQLRLSLLDKLKARDATRILSKQASFAHKAAASLVQEFLLAHGHNYSLSVFVPEVGGGLLQSHQLQSLLKMEKGQCSLLQTLISRRLPTQNSTLEAMVQTEGSSDFLLQQKLRSLEDRHYRDLDRGSDGGAEERMAKFQNQTRARLKEQMRRQVDRVRFVETAAVRTEEAQKARMRIAAMKEQFQTQYFQKLHRLKERQRESLALVKHKMEELQMNVHSQRNRVQAQLDYIQQREQELLERERRDSDWLASEKTKLQRLQRQLKEERKQIYGK